MTHRTKDLLVIVALALLTIGARPPERTFQELNGHDWMSWSYERRAAWLCGWAMALWYVENEDPSAPIALDLLMTGQRLRLEPTLDEMNDYYRAFSAREAPLVRALYAKGEFPE